ncbi:MAG: chromate transporter [Heliobacteriaceae bacterium]|jgi:chromate transporter|nr:chromate transporter [Heliobacteriaceae bacterium]
MIYTELFTEFFRIGFFSFGGGHATLPFLYNIAAVKHWYTVRQLADIIAISSVTPGPVGVNAATFAGYSTAGIAGALIATVSVVLPSFIIIIIVSHLLKQFRENKYVQSVIYVIKPVSCGLLAAVGAEMFVNNVNNIFGFALLAALFVTNIYKKRKPAFFLAVSAFAGFAAGFFNLIN